MKLLLVGHSYVRDLWRREVRGFEVGGTVVQTRYVFKGGASYETYLNSPELLGRIGQESADIVVVILAGNSIKDSVTNQQIYEKATLFYRRLRIIFPSAIFVAAEVEQRFYELGNYWGCPVGLEYKRRRQAINTFLKRFKEKQHLLMVAGPRRLDNQDLYRDQVHLTNKGLDRYWKMIIATVDYVISNNQLLLTTNNN